MERRRTAAGSCWCLQGSEREGKGRGKRKQQLALLLFNAGVVKRATSGQAYEY